METQPRDHGGSWLPPTPPLPVKLSGVDSCCPSVLLSDHFPTRSIVGQQLQKQRCWAAFPACTPPALSAVRFPAALPDVSQSTSLLQWHSWETLWLLSLSRRGKRQRERSGQQAMQSDSPLLQRRVRAPGGGGPPAPRLPLSRLLLFIWGAAARGGRGAQSRGRLLLPARLLLVA